jgi:hypothetical protein
VTLRDARLLALKAIGLTDTEADYKQNCALVDPIATAIRRAWVDGRVSYGQDTGGREVCAALFRCPLPPEHRGGHAYERMDVVDE